MKTAAPDARRTALHETGNDIPHGARAKLVDLLNSSLSSCIDLSLQAKQAHWNVKGPTFIALHKLFDKVAGAAQEALDEIAERAVALGGVARGTAQTVARSSGLEAYPEDAVAGADHVRALSRALSTFGAHARAGIAHATGLGDAGTADLYTEISREIDKVLWMVEAHAVSAR